MSDPPRASDLETVLTFKIHTHLHDSFRVYCGAMKQIEAWSA